MDPTGLRSAVARAARRAANPRFAPAEDVAMFRSVGAPEEVGDGDVIRFAGKRVGADKESGAAERITRVGADNTFARLRAQFAAMPNVVIRDEFEDLPKHIQQQAREQGHSPKGLKGVFHDGNLYVVLNNHSSLEDLEATALHKLIGHFGIRRLLGAESGPRLTRLFAQLGGIMGLCAIAAKYKFGDDSEGYIDGMIAGQHPTRRCSTMTPSRQCFAHIAEQKRPRLTQLWQELVGAISAALRKLGLAELAE